MSRDPVLYLDYVTSSHPILYARAKASFHMSFYVQFMDPCILRYISILCCA